MKKTKKITLSAMLSALSVVLLWLGSAVQVLDLSAAVLSSFAVIFAQIELRPPYSYLIWITTSLLSFLLPLPNKVAALYYAGFCGIYVILKAYIERLRPPLSWVVKIFVFNLLFIGICAVNLWVFTPDFRPEKWLIVAVLALGNVAFVCYDLAVSMCISFYFARLRGRILKFLK